MLFLYLYYDVKHTNNFTFMLLTGALKTQGIPENELKKEVKEKVEEKVAEKGENRKERREERHTKPRSKERSGDFLALDLGEPKPGEDLERFNTREEGSPRIEGGV